MMRKKKAAPKWNLLMPPEFIEEFKKFGITVDPEHVTEIRPVELGICFTTEVPGLPPCRITVEVEGDHQWAFSHS